MVTHLRLASASSRIPGQRNMPMTMYNRIIKCFCLSNDTVGVYVALETLNNAFGSKPSIATIKDIVKHIAIQNSATEHHEQAPQRPWEEHIAASMELLESTFLNDSEYSKHANNSIDALYELDSSASGDDILHLLSKYVWKAAAFRYPLVDELSQQLHIAKREIGVLNLTT